MENNIAKTCNFRVDNVDKIIELIGSIGFGVYGTVFAYNDAYKKPCPMGWLLSKFSDSENDILDAINNVVSKNVFKVYINKDLKSSFYVNPYYAGKQLVKIWED